MRVSPRHHLVQILAVLAIVVPLPSAMTQELSLDDLAREAEFVFRGRVASRTSKWETFEGNRFISTDVTFSVITAYKGDPGNQITLNFLGGQVGDEGMSVSGMPHVEVGDELILFTNADPAAACPILGWSSGAFEVSDDSLGDKEVSFTAQVDPTPASASPEPPSKAPDKPSKMDLPQAENLIRSTIEKIRRAPSPQPAP